MFRSLVLRRLALLPFSISLAHCGVTMMDGPRRVANAPAVSAKLPFRLTGSVSDRQSLSYSSVSIELSPGSQTDSSPQVSVARCSGIAVGARSVLVPAHCIRDLASDDLRIRGAGNASRDTLGVKVDSIAFEPGLDVTRARFALLRLSAFPAGVSAASIAQGTASLGSAFVVSGFVSTVQTGTEARSELHSVSPAPVLPAWGFFAAKPAPGEEVEGNFQISWSTEEAGLSCVAVLGSGVFSRGAGEAMSLVGLVLPTADDACGVRMSVADVRGLSAWVQNAAR